MHLQPETGFRESYRIKGETLITVQDYTSGKLFDDAVSYAFYPVDLHTKSGVRPKPLKRGIVPSIPLGQYRSRNLIVAGRCDSDLGQLWFECRHPAWAWGRRQRSGHFSG